MKSKCERRGRRKDIVEAQKRQGSCMLIFCPEGKNENTKRKVGCGLLAEGLECQNRELAQSLVVSGKPRNVFEKRSIIKTVT